MVDRELIEKARRNKLYIVDVRIVGRFVEGGETLKTFELLLEPEQHEQLLMLLAQFNSVEKTTP